MAVRKQRGTITLLVTALLLLAALIATLGTFKGTLHQIKVSQNEVSTRQAHWKLEGGLECAYSLIISDVPTALPKLTADKSPAFFNTSCTKPLGIHEIKAVSLTGAKYKLTATFSDGGYQLSKSVVVDDGTGKGAIQTAADLEIHSSNTVDIDPDIKTQGEDKGIHECVAMRYLNKVTYVHGPTGSHLNTTIPDHAVDRPEGFNSCKERTEKLTSNASLLKGMSTPAGAFKNDYIYDPDIDLFSNFFKVPKTDANVDKLKLGYRVITLTDGEDCGKTINDNFLGRIKTATESAIAPTNKLWLVGDCVTQTGFDITGAVERSLVVQNGVVVMHGAQVFDGAFYHYVDMNMFFHHGKLDKAKAKKHWDDLAALHSVISDNFILNGTETAADKPIHVKDFTVYIANGSFFPKGGMYFDAPGGLSILSGSVNLDFRGERNPHKNSDEVTWLKGSWNDL